MKIINYIYFIFHLYLYLYLFYLELKISISIISQVVVTRWSKSLLFLILLSYIVVPIKDKENTFFFTLAIITSDSIIDLPALVKMDINDFNVGNINNYNNIREYTMSSNKATFRMVSMFLSEILEDYATKVECLNNVFDDDEIREPINSSQLSYIEQRGEEIQVSRATSYENRIRKQ